MAQKRVAHIVKVGTFKLGTLLPNIYSNIGETVGVVPAMSTDSTTGVVTTVKADFPATVNELRKAGAALSINIRTETGKSHRILCAVTKLSSAITGLVGMTVPESGNILTDALLGDQKKIVRVSIPRRRFRY